MSEVRCVNPPATVTTDDGTTYSFAQDDDVVEMEVPHAETVISLNNFEYV